MIKQKFRINHLALAVMVASCSAMAEEVEFRGFFQAAAGYNDLNGKRYLGWSEDKIVFDHNVFALQATGEISENASATVQMIARGTQNTYGVSTEWAYLTYDINDSLKLRAGRLRTPLYMYSDFLEVGYAYPWIAPPREVYYIPFNNIEGLDLYKTGTLGAFDWTAQTYFGSFSEKADVFNIGLLTPVQSRNQVGLVGTLGRDWWTLRMAYHTAEQSIDMATLPMPGTGTFGGYVASLRTPNGATSIPTIKGYLAAAFKSAPQLAGNADLFKGEFDAVADSLEAKKDRATYKEIGWNIDTGRFVSVAEYTQLDIADSFYPTAVRYYGMVGVRFGDWLIHYTAQQNKDKPSSPHDKFKTYDKTSPLYALVETGYPVPDPANPGKFITVPSLKSQVKDIAKNFSEDRDVNIYGVRWDFMKNTALKFDYNQIDDSKYGKQNLYTLAVQAIF